jgi:hypothetical protein
MTVVIDDWNDPVLLCADCHTAAFAVPPVDQGQREGWPLSYEDEDSLGSCECGECFATWLRDTGGGDLLERVREGRARDAAGGWRRPVA